MKYTEVFTNRNIVIPDDTARVIYYQLGDVPWRKMQSVDCILTNVSNETQRITDIETDCNCLVIECPQTEIQPNAQVTIKVHFDPQILGTFQREIIVHTAEQRTYHFAIVGRIVKESWEVTKFKTRIGDISLSTSVIDFGDLRKGEHKECTIYVRNDGNESYMPSLMHLPSYFTAYAVPELLRPGRIGKMVITANTQLIDNWGMVNTDIYLSRNNKDKVSVENELPVQLTLLPNIDNLDLQRDKYPMIQIDTLVDLGSFGDRKYLTTQILVQNIGQDKLQIHRLQVYDTNLSVALPKTLLQVGESTKLKIKMKRLSNLKPQRILLISNDPQKTKLIITVKAKA